MRHTLIMTMAATTALLLSTATYAQSRDFDLTGFDRVDIATGLDASVILGDSFSVRAESRSQEALDNLELGVDGGVLNARLEQNFLDFIVSGGLVGMLLNNGNAVSIEITMPALTGVNASSGADVHLTGIRSESLDLDASSGANISVAYAVLGTARISSSSGADVDIAGTADAVEADASSGADINAGDLVARNAVAEVSSGADISIHATASVRAGASSGGAVEVHGNPPQRDIDSSSGGDVNFRD